MFAVIEGRSAEVLGSRLHSPVPAWRRGVKVVVTDMAECYRKAMRTRLPHVQHVADRFHVVCNFSQALVSARRDASSPPGARRHVASVFQARYMLMKRLDRLSGAEAVRLCGIFEAPSSAWSGPWCSASNVIFVAEDEESANPAGGGLHRRPGRRRRQLAGITTFSR